MPSGHHILPLTTAIKQRKSKLNVLVLSMDEAYQLAFRTMLDTEIGDEGISPHLSTSHQGLSASQISLSRADHSAKLMVHFGFI